MKTKENMKKGVKNNKKNIFYKVGPSGISLIVLVITIIVIIILAAVVILTLNNNNPIEEANKARIESDIANMQAIFTNTVAKVMAQNQGTIELNAGSLNSIKSGASSAEGSVNYNLNNPKNENNKEGMIIFNIATSDSTTYYTGRMLPLYASGETTWYVDSDGIISLKIGEIEYGSGEKTDSPAGGETITASESPTLQTWAYNSTTDFHNSAYRSKITKVKFALADKVPSAKIESWDISSSKDKSIMSWIEDDGNGGYVLTIAGKEKIKSGTSLNYMFYDFPRLEKIENIELLDTKNTRWFKDVFSKCTNLKTIEGELSLYELVDSCIIYNCPNLTATINLRGSGAYNNSHAACYNSATIAPAQITFNYDTNTEWVVNYIISKQPNSNIVKGRKLD